MVSLRDSLVSSSARRLTIRRRPDLIARRHHYLGRSYWVVKDPIALQYYRFQEEEYAILLMLDGETSLDEIKERFEDEFPPQKITLDELQQFLGMLHRSGLILASVPGQGRQLEKRRNERKRKEFLQAASNILCIRFKGIDPERLLNGMYPFVRWFFTWPVFILSILFALSALTLILVEFDVFRSKLPEFHQFFNPGNAFWLMVVLCVTKVCHEFGHALTCKHFGGECHEMGVMVLVLTPCLYCNVSDSWMLPNKWQRAAIGAAGMYVELVIASFCTYIWWFSMPGLLNNLCLNVIFVSSVSTVIFNANPLLRYDGYYILSDLTEIPNLRQKASTILGRKMAEWFLGMEMSEDPFLPQRKQLFFALYTVAAAIYRWVVTFSICWFLYKLFESYQLKVIGQLVVAMSLWALFFMPLYKVGKFFYIPGRLDKVKKSHFYPSLAGVIVLAALFVFLPLPQSILVPFEIQARDAESVNVEVPGTLAAINVKQGQYVTQGTLLGELSEPNLDVEIERTRGQLEATRSRLKAIREISFTSRDELAPKEIAQIEESIKSYQVQLEKLEADRERLKLIAPIDGVVLPPPYQPHREDPEVQLSSWYGIPLDKKNLGAYLDRKVMFCQVGDPKKLEAVLYIDQTDRNLVAAGQNADLKIDEMPHKTYNNHKIESIAEAEVRDVSKRMSNKNGGELSTKTDENSMIERPISTTYQAMVPIDDDQGVLRLGLRGTARIYVDPVPLGTRFWRFVMHTFKFKM